MTGKQPNDSEGEQRRPGLYLCCMRTAERYYDRNAHGGIDIGHVITCSNAQCRQPIKYTGNGGWKHADAK